MSRPGPVPTQQNAGRLEATEWRELETDSVGELRELTNIYVKRGLTHALAHDVAVQLTEHNALDMLRDLELGDLPEPEASPLQAATTSAINYACGARYPCSRPGCRRRPP